MTKSIDPILVKFDTVAKWCYLVGELDYNDVFDYLSNCTSNQIEQKIDHYDQNGQWVLTSETFS